MNWKNLSDEVRRKVRHYYAIKYRGKFFEERIILQDFNESLRQEIAIHNCKSFIQNVPFLNRKKGDGRDEYFMGRIATSLTDCYFVKGDVLCTAGQIGQ